MKFKFLHAADIHLDSPLVGLSAYEGAPVERLRGATREALVRIVDLALAEAVAFVVIAGDLYDGDWKDFNTGLFFARQMGRLGEAGISVYSIDGNHDARSAMTKSLSLPANVFKFSSGAAETFRIDEWRVALHGRSFRDRETRENLVREYPAAIAGWFNIGVLHTSLEGDGAHAAYAPCSLADLTAKGYDYWALGHVHEGRTVAGNPWIVYPGNPQGRHIRETGERGVVLVEVEDGRACIERRTTDVLRWLRLEADVTGAETFDEAVARAARRLRQAVEDAGAIPLAVRVDLTGRTPAHGALRAYDGRLRQELLAAANEWGGERVWIEKVRARTSPPLDAGTLRERSDALADLSRLLEEAAGDPKFVALAERDLEEFRNRAASEILASGESLAELVAEVAPGIVARIESEGE